MYFPAAGIDVNPLVPPVVALVVSFLTSMGGVSGAFLLLPFQMSVLGYVAPSVSPTNQFFNVIATPSGVYRYFREGRMVWPLAWVVVLGTLPGVIVGGFVRVLYLPDPRKFKIFAATVLLYVGYRLVSDLLGKKSRNTPLTSKKHGANAGERHQEGVGVACVSVRHFSLSKIIYEYQGECFECGTCGIFGLSFLVGIVGGIYGVGGAAIISPFLVAIYRLPIHTVAGAALLGTFITSIAGVLFYQVIAPFYPSMSVAPDWGLGTLFGIGGMVGMYLGAHFQKYVPAKGIKWMLVGLILFLAIKYLLEFLR